MVILIFVLGILKRLMEEQKTETDRLTVYFTPSLLEMIDHQKYASLWARNLKETLHGMEYGERPLHIISANMHSMRNLLYGPGTLEAIETDIPDDLYEMVRAVRDIEDTVVDHGCKNGFLFLEDGSGSTIDVNIIDLSSIDEANLHPALDIDMEYVREQKPVLVVIDYAFGTQAFAIMDELLSPIDIEGNEIRFQIESISIMGKAGVLPGKKGDIMLASSHVMEGTANNYIVNNDLKKADFSDDVDVYEGPMLTVLGTSLQNRDVLERFHSSSWKAIGLEMEGGHYQRAISGAIIRGHIPANMKTRYAYYASDNPMVSGQTLASGPMGDEGIVPTYMISKVILEKIANPEGK
jgi:hypothetical protein